MPLCLATRCLLRLEGVSLHTASGQIRLQGRDRSDNHNLSRPCDRKSVSELYGRKSGHTNRSKPIELTKRGSCFLVKEKSTRLKNRITVQELGNKCFKEEDFSFLHGTKCTLLFVACLYLLSFSNYSVKKAELKLRPQLRVLPEIRSL